MIGRRRDRGDQLDVADVAPSPWATDAIVAGPAPEFEWDPVVEKADDDLATTGEAGRRNRVLLAVGCVVALLVAGLVLWPGGDEPLDDAADADADEPAPKLDSLPGVTSASEAADAEPEGGSEADDSNDPILSSAPENAEGEITSIVLPASVAAITEPTEIVMVAGGEIVTVSLPSGTVGARRQARRPATVAVSSWPPTRPPGSGIPISASFPETVRR